MLNDFTGADKVYIACGYTDLRKGIDGLARLVQQQFELDPFTNTLFLFCGRRRDRIKGLYWEKDGFILLYKRLEQGAYQWPRSESEVKALTPQQLHQEKGLAAYELVPTKNSRSRTLVASPTVVARLRHRKAEQTQQRLMAGCAWEDSNLVFTGALGHHLTKPTVYRHYKKAVAAIGRPDARYHDLRHSYAVAAISSGIDIKTVQGNLGHATAAFTLDVYGHVTDRMKRESADKMEDFIRRVSGD